MIATNLKRFSQICILFLVSAAALVGQTREASVIKGAVFDQTLEAVVPGTKVTVTGNGVVKTEVTDNAGEYEFSLPMGIYEITTDTRWWFPVTRSKVIVAEDSQVTVNLYLTSQEVVQSLEATSKGIIDRYKARAKNPKFEIIPARGLAIDSFVVEFKSRASEHKEMIFRNAKLTNNALTLIADEIRVDKHTGKVSATNAFVDSNGVRSRIESYIIP